MWGRAPKKDSLLLVQSAVAHSKSNYDGGGVRTLHQTKYQTGQFNSVSRRDKGLVSTFYTRKVYERYTSIEMLRTALSEHVGGRRTLVEWLGIIPWDARTAGEAKIWLSCLPQALRIRFVFVGTYLGYGRRSWSNRAGCWAQHRPFGPCRIASAHRFKLMRTCMAHNTLVVCQRHIPA